MNAGKGGFEIRLESFEFLGSGASRILLGDGLEWNSASEAFDDQRFG